MTDSDNPDVEAFYYSRQTADAMIYGGMTAAAICTLGAISRDLSGLYVGTALGLAVATFHQPMSRKTRPQLMADPHGLFVDGLGLVPWHMIRTTRYKERHHRGIVLGVMHIELTATPAVALTRREEHSWIRNFQTHIWTQGTQEIKIDLRALEGDPREIYDTIEHYRKDRAPSLALQSTSD